MQFSTFLPPQERKKKKNPRELKFLTNNTQLVSKLNFSSPRIPPLNGPSRFHLFHLLRNKIKGRIEFEKERRSEIKRLLPIYCVFSFTITVTESIQILKTEYGSNRGTRITSKTGIVTPPIKPTADHRIRFRSPHSSSIRKASPPSIYIIRAFFFLLNVLI